MFSAKLTSLKSGGLFVFFTYMKLTNGAGQLDVGLSADVVIAVPTYIKTSSQTTIHVQNYSSAVAYFIWEK